MADELRNAPGFGLAGRSAGRRAVLGALAAAPFGVPALARAADFPTASYDSALVIDGQGALADPYAKEGSEDPRAQDTQKSDRRQRQPGHRDHA